MVKIIYTYCEIADSKLKNLSKKKLETIVLFQVKKQNKLKDSPGWVICEKTCKKTK